MKGKLIFGYSWYMIWYEMIWYDDSGEMNRLLITLTLYNIVTLLYLTLLPVLLSYNNSGYSNSHLHFIPSFIHLFMSYCNCQPTITVSKHQLWTHRLFLNLISSIKLTPMTTNMISLLTNRTIETLMLHS